MRTGTFREDLYFRLNGMPVHVPPLRERVDDIPMLATFFLQRAATRTRRTSRFTAKPWQRSSLQLAGQHP